MDIGGYTEYTNMDDFAKNSFWSELSYRFPIQFGVLLFVLLPLCLLKNIGKLRFTSILGVGSMLVMYFVVFAESPMYIIDYWNHKYKADDPTTHLNIYNIGIGFNKELSFLKGTATLFYGFGTHYGAYPIMRVLENRSYDRLQKIFFRGILFCGTLYMMMGIIGYLSVPLDTPDLIIERYNILIPDVCITIGRTLFISTLMFKIPANYNSLRISIMTLLFKKSEFEGRLKYFN